MSLYIPVLLGTIREGRRSAAAAQLITDVGNAIDQVTTELVDPCEFSFPSDGNAEEVKDPRYTRIIERADAFFIVTPEYNHSFPASLKRMLDSESTLYVHKPVALAGVSSGQFGGVRAIQSLVPVVRELGMIATSTDIFFPKIADLIDENGQIHDVQQVERVQKAFDELIWMASALQWGRDNNHAT